MKAVLFDLDDTITDRNASLHAVARQLCSDFPGLGSEETTARELIRADVGGYRARIDTFADVVSALQWKRAPTLDEVVIYWERTFPLHVVARDGALELISRLRGRGVIVGLLSNGGSKPQRLKLATLGLEAMLDPILISEELGLAKPEAAIFEAAAERLACKLDQIVMVGENPVNDASAALDAGWRAIWLKTADTWRAEELPRCPAVTSMSEVGALLG